MISIFKAMSVLYSTTLISAGCGITRTIGYLQLGFLVLNKKILLNDAPLLNWSTPPCLQ